MAELLSYQTVAGFAEDRFEEKKSVFIGSCTPCETWEAAREFIASVRRRYPDANHHVTAFLNREGNVCRFDDDGEPKGTGGVPVMEVLKKESVTGICVVITRYFGGILLGAGGLARAYAKGARIALEKAGVCRFSRREVLRFSLGYPQLSKTEYELQKKKIPVLQKEFGEEIFMEILVSSAQKTEAETLLRELTGGRVDVEFVRFEFARDDF